MGRQVCLTLALAAVVMSVGGCPTQYSSDVRTSGMYCRYWIDEPQGAATVTAHAEFWAGNEPYGATILLTDGDAIRVNGVELNLVEEPLTEIKYYEADIAPADVFQFNLDRAGEGVYISTLNMPAPVNITSPRASDIVSRTSNHLVVQWDDNGNGGNVDFTFHGCEGDIDGGSVADDGEKVYEPGEIEYDDDNCYRHCDACSGDAYILITRYAYGQLSSALQGDMTGATTGRSQTFTSVH